MRGLKEFFRNDYLNKIIFVERRWYKVKERNEKRGSQREKKNNEDNEMIMKSNVEKGEKRIGWRMDIVMIKIKIVIFELHRGI